MSLFKSFAFSEQGFNHLKVEKECQDASGCYSDDAMTIIVVADGHGSDNYPRTARGSEFAVQSAISAIREFVYAVKFNCIAMVDEHEDRIRSLEANILKQWHKAVDDDVVKFPFQENELEKVSEKYKARYLSGDYNAKAYGTTLIAACITPDYWFGIQIGDGKCVSFSADGDCSEPIPWDEACQMNVTTSICDENALDEFRSYFSVDLPLAVFAGSDGIDDSFVGETELHAVYRAMIGIYGEYGEEVVKKEVSDFLPKTSRKGSGDDVSIAAAIQTDLQSKTLELFNAIADYKSKAIRMQQIQRELQIADERYQYVLNAVASSEQIDDSLLEKQDRAKNDFDSLSALRDKLKAELKGAEDRIDTIRGKTDSI